MKENSTIYVHSGSKYFDKYLFNKITECKHADIISAIIITDIYIIKHQSAGFLSSLLVLKIKYTIYA